MSRSPWSSTILTGRQSAATHLAIALVIFAVVALLTDLTPILHCVILSWRWLPASSVLALLLAQGYWSPVIGLRLRWYFRLVVLRWYDNTSRQYLQTTLLLSKSPLGSFLNRNWFSRTPMSDVSSSAILGCQAAGADWGVATLGPHRYGKPHVLFFFF